MVLEPLVVCLIGMLVVVGAILGLRLHAFLALLLATLTVMLLTPLVPAEYEVAADWSGIGKRLGTAFGTGCGKVGILIALAAIIGQCLLETGAAQRIVQSLLRLFGEKRAPLAFLSSGFCLGIPVFFDTVFYLLFPLVRAFARRAESLYLLAVLSVVAGASMAHSLVPPTPGPLFVASSLDVDLGVMIPAGFFLGIGTITVGYLYARWANRRWPVPLRETPEEAEAEAQAEAGPSLPPLFLSLLPLLIPIGLIVFATIYDAMGHGSRIPAFLGDKNIALGIGAAFALGIAARARKSASSSPSDIVRRALETGGVIILITAAGAAFGQAMRESGVATQFAGAMPESGGGIVLLTVAFGLTAAVRIAQGSATVAMITAVGILQPMLAGIELGFHPVYLALAIGCGSKPGSWMNDSGFWIVSRMSGMTVAETLRTWTVLLTLMGCAGFLLVLIAARLLPLI